MRVTVIYQSACQLVCASVSEFVCLSACLSVCHSVCHFVYVSTNRFLSASVPVVLVGNKIDLHMDRAVTLAQGQGVAASWRAAFVETSAKQNEVHYSSITNKQSDVIILYVCMYVYRKFPKYF